MHTAPRARLTASRTRGSPATGPGAHTSQQSHHTWNDSGTPSTLRHASRCTLAVVIAVVVPPLVDGAAACVHEEVCHGGHLQSQLLRDRGLHLLRRPFCLLKYCMQGPPLNVSKHKSWLFWAPVLLGGRNVRLFSLDR